MSVEVRWLSSVEVRGKVEVGRPMKSRGELRGVIRVQVVVGAGAMQSTSRQKFVESREINGQK